MLEKNQQQNFGKDGLIDYISRVMRANEDFLYQNARDACEEVIELINDAIDDARVITSKENYGNRAMSFFLLHVFMPQSYAMYVDLLSGNLPICFVELRLMVEALAKSLYADYKYPADTFFGGKFAELDQELEKRRLTIAKIVKAIDAMLDTEVRLFDLWQKLSKEWAHAEGVARRLVDYVVHREEGPRGVPPWSLAIPMDYDKGDLQDINELGQDITKFRKILGVAIGKTP